MTTLARRNSSIHKLREFTLPKLILEQEYEVVHTIQEGWRGRLLLVEHKRTRHEVVLKAIHKDTSTRVEFFREFHYNYYLSPHKNILNAYDVAFQSGDYYLFAQEFAPFGDLTTNLVETGLGEMNVKKIAPQLVSALEFIHSKDLVHRNINMDNVLVFNVDFSEIKLCDFGSTRKEGAVLKKKTVWLPYAPPEIVATVQNESFRATSKHDVWQLGILLYVLLTGALPWQKADITDPHYMEFINWKKRKTMKTPKRFSNFTTKALKMFRRILEPKEDKRSSVKEVTKYLEYKWLTRPMRRTDKDTLDNQSVCYSTMSIHSSKIEKDLVLHALKAHGIETTVDRVAKRKRIHEWIERSLTNNHMFEDQEETNSSNSNNNVVKREPPSPPWDAIDQHESFSSVIQGEIQNNKETKAAAKQEQQLPVKMVSNSRKQIIEPGCDRGRIVSISQLDCSQLDCCEIMRRNSSYRSREAIISTNLKPISRHQSFNVTRRSSIQDTSRTTTTTEFNSRSKSQYHQSPSRDPHSPLRIQKQSNELQENQKTINQFSQEIRMAKYNSHVEKLKPLKASIKSTTAAVRSNSDRIKTKTDPKLSRIYSKSNTSSDCSIHRSRTAPSVDDNQRLLLVNFLNNSSEDSESRSDDSLTSIIPMAFNS